MIENNKVIKNRCEWCLKDQMYMDYHDNIWGVPEYRDQKLFEYINLEGAQAGLSWYTILKRIDSYSEAFAKWDALKIAAFGEKEIASLMGNDGIIKNRLKINAAIGNARAYLQLKKESSFSDYLWHYVDGKPIINEWKSHSEIPSSTSISDKLSKDLKKRGFKFVGPTIVYAFMQAVGMVDDHLTDCWKRKS